MTVSLVYFTMTWKSDKLLPLAGILVSIYALYVEHQKALNPDYEAACDISEKASCSKVLMSSYGHILSQWGLVSEGSLLDVPNPVLGIGFYGLVLLWPYQRREVVLCASIGSLLFSFYLAFILYSVLGDFCIVCVSSYAINAWIFMLELSVYCQRGESTPSIKVSRQQKTKNRD